MTLHVKYIETALILRMICIKKISSIFFFTKFTFYISKSKQYTSQLFCVTLKHLYFRTSILKDIPYISDFEYLVMAFCHNIITIISFIIIQIQNAAKESME